MEIRNVSSVIAGTLLIQQVCADNLTQHAGKAIRKQGLVFRVIQDLIYWAESAFQMFQLWDSMLIRTVLRLMEQNAYSAIKGTLLPLIMSAPRWIFYVKVTLYKMVSATLATLNMYYRTANAYWVKICIFPSANRRTPKENVFNATIAITYPKIHVSLSLFCVTPITKYQENVPLVH